MKKLAVAVFMLMPLPSAAQEPSIVLAYQDGVPQIQIDETQTACPAGGLNSQTRQAIIDAAAAEWSLFRFPRFAITAVKNYNVIPPGISPDKKRTRAQATFVPRVLPIGHMEDDKEVRKRIGDYWASVRFHDVFVIQNQIWRYTDGRAGWGLYWSAAFVSFVMCKAGLGNAEFVRSGTHVAYIRPAVAQRDGARSGYVYTAYDLGEAVPAPGDLLCAAREDDEMAIDNLEAFRQNARHGSYHCDIVVGFDVADAKKAGVLYAIGGNVINAVSLTEAPIARGHVVKVRTPGGRNWFALLKLQDTAGPAKFQKIPAAITDSAEKIAKRPLRRKGASAVVAASP
jgi:Uncharacterized protein conserved in bacteria (DUF2272)